MGSLIERALSGSIRLSWQAEAAHFDCKLVSGAYGTAFFSPPLSTETAAGTTLTVRGVNNSFAYFLRS